MLSHVSWMQFGTCMLVITICYYAVIIAWQYKFSQLIHSFKKHAGHTNMPLQDESLFPIVHTLLDNLDRKFSELPPQADKQVILSIIKTENSHFPQIKDTAFVRAINHKIKEKLSRSYSIQLSEEDLAGTWIQL